MIEENNCDQDKIYKFDNFNFKEADTNIYTLKINSESRNILNEPNPFNFEVTFNQDSNNGGASILSKFENIKKIKIANILIPRFIPRDYMGEPVNGVTFISDYNANTINLSYYPGINLNNTVITIKDLSNNEHQIEVIELVDLNNKKIYLIALEYNNPYYLSRYINIKADLFSYINIDNYIYPITNIIGSQLTLNINIEKYSLPINTNNRLIIGDFYKNIITVENKTINRISIDLNNIYIYKVNFCNYEYLFPNQYIEFQVNTDLKLISERKLFKINSISKYNNRKKLPYIANNTTIDVIDIISDISNNYIKIQGEWTNGPPSEYSDINPQTFFNDKIVKISQFNFGIKDLLNEKIFYLNVYPFVPTKRVSTEDIINDSFGVFFPSTQSSDYLFLKGDVTENYTLNNLKSSNLKMKFTLLDSNYKVVGEIYNKYPTLYKPSLFNDIKSFLPNSPEMTIIMQIEEIERKNINQPIDIN